MCDAMCDGEVYAHVSRRQRQFCRLCAFVCVRGYLRILLAWERRGEEARGEEMRWKVPVGGWRFEMVISLAQD